VNDKSAVDSRGAASPGGGPAWAEADRLSALERYKILDTPPEPAFDDIVRIAARICDVPMALISLVDDRRQWFKAAVGLSVSETPRGIAFCAHAIQQENRFLVEDAHQDDRFVANPLVTGYPNLRFYAGAQLKTPDGFPLGTLCVLDSAPRQLTLDQLETLSALSRQVMAQLELRRILQLREAEAAEKTAMIGRMEGLLADKELLLQEVHHRVKNGLATVQALLVLQARTASDPEAARQLRESAGRIQTFAAMHEHLYRVGAAAQVDMAAYLRSLIDDQRAAFTPGLAGRRIAFDADPGRWPSAQAPAVGMIMVELVTNALKYGNGTVTVSFRQNGDDAVLIVADEGNGLPADFDPTRGSGLGMRIVGGLMRGEGGAELQLDRASPHTRFVARLKRPTG
jgi:two-component sensor histidine kinase